MQFFNKKNFDSQKYTLLFLMISLDNKIYELMIFMKVKTKVMIF